jgi:hypothetical protein
MVNLFAEPPKEMMVADIRVLGASLDIRYP